MELPHIVDGWMMVCSTIRRKCLYEVRSRCVFFERLLLWKIKRNCKDLLGKNICIILTTTKKKKQERNRPKIVLNNYVFKLTIGNLIVDSVRQFQIYRM